MGELRAPADKSISHRAALLGAMSSEPVRIERYLHAADTHSTLDAVRALGALVEVHDDAVIVRGTGLREAREPERPDRRRQRRHAAAAAARLAGGAGRALVHARRRRLDPPPAGRPDRRAARAQMGAELRPASGRYPPLVVRGARLRAISYELDGRERTGEVVRAARRARRRRAHDRERADPQPRPHRAHAAARRASRSSARTSACRSLNADELLLEQVRVPGDASSAAFLVAAGVLVPGSRLLIRDVGVNWTRTGFLRIVRRMRGIVLGDLEESRRGSRAGEPVSDLDVAHGALEGTVVEPDEVPLAIDELPLVALLGCFAEGETVVRGAQELRVKESDRIAGVVEGLRGLGADIEATEDGFAVRGSGGLRGGTLDARGDHRLAMMGAVAGLASRRASRCSGWTPPRSPTPGSSRTSAASRAVEPRRW